MRKSLKGERTMKPLTIDELKALQVGDWVWFLHNQVKPCYGTIMSKHDDTIYFNTTEGLQRVHWKNYGKTWVVHKNKEQAEAEEYKIDFDEHGGWEVSKYIPAHYQPWFTADTKEEAQQRIKELQGENK